MWVYFLTTIDLVTLVLFYIVQYETYGAVKTPFLTLLQATSGGV